MKSKSNKKSTSGASSADWKYFDDCLICHAMERSEKQGRSLSGEELKAAFKKANAVQKQQGK